MKNLSLIFTYFVGTKSSFNKISKIKPSAIEEIGNFNSVETCSESPANP